MGPLGTKRLFAFGISGAAVLTLLGVAAWMVFNGSSDDRRPEGVQIIAPLEEPNSDVDGSPAPTVSSLAPTVTPSPQRIAVYITGEVVNPGVYRVADGDRLETVLQLAGGPTENADLSRINLAAYATDTAHYRIPEVGETVGAEEPLVDASKPDSIEASASQGCQEPVNINTASAHCLETLPGIGRVRAESIIAHREQEGPFPSPEAITDVPGIGDGIYRRIADMITVAAP